MNFTDAVKAAVDAAPPLTPAQAAALRSTGLRPANGNAGPHHKAGVTCNTITSTATAWKSGGQDDSTP